VAIGLIHQGAREGLHDERQTSRLLFWHSLLFGLLMIINRGKAATSLPLPARAEPCGSLFPPLWVSILKEAENRLTKFHETKPPPNVNTTDVIFHRDQPHNSLMKSGFNQASTNTFSWFAHPSHIQADSGATLDREQMNELGRDHHL